MASFRGLSHKGGVRIRGPMSTSKIRVTGGDPGKGSFG